jgi:hypothetical protein
VAGLQASSVQALLSLQTRGVPPTQVPLLQVSPVVQALPSLHDAVLLVKVHPVDGLQASFVQAFPSLHTTGAPATHAPFWQVSPALQALPSLHVVPLAALASGQVGPVPVQKSFASHAPVAVPHCVVAGAKALVGQALLEPVQVSAVSHVPAEARHTVVLGA